jgi:hypothetical protein
VFGVPPLNLVLGDDGGSVLVGLGSQVFASDQAFQSDGVWFLAVLDEPLLGVAAVAWASPWWMSACIGQARNNWGGTLKPMV